MSDNVLLQLHLLQHEQTVFRAFQSLADGFYNRVRLCKKSNAFLLQPTLHLSVNSQKIYNRFFIGTKVVNQIEMKVG